MLCEIKESAEEDEGREKTSSRKVTYFMVFLIQAPKKYT